MQIASVDGLTHIALGWRLSIGVDAVLRNQGADPAVLRVRSPKLVALAEKALTEGMHLLEPAIAYRHLRIESLRHKRLTLQGGAQLTGRLIAQHLASAQQVVAFVATIGDRLDARVSEVFGVHAPYAMALDGLGSAAVEALAVAACDHFRQIAAADGMHGTIPLSPGMIDWPVDEGQRQIFGLLDASQIGVQLTPSSQMIPRKSLSMVLGLGRDVTEQGSACDYCSLRETCRYQDHYADIQR